MTSHANCTHAATKAARAACRRMPRPADLTPEAQAADLANLAKLRAAKAPVSASGVIGDVTPGRTSTRSVPAPYVPTQPRKPVGGTPDSARCSGCGANDHETIATVVDGYTACCNEPLTYPLGY